jgi:hypothetical protein
MFMSLTSWAIVAESGIKQQQSHSHSRWTLYTFMVTTLLPQQANWQCSCWQCMPKLLFKCSFTPLNLLTQPYGLNLNSCDISLLEDNQSTNININQCQWEVWPMSSWYPTFLIWCPWAKTTTITVQLQLSCCLNTHLLHEPSYPALWQWLFQLPWEA